MTLDTITHMYEGLTYYDQYGGSLLLFILISLVVVLAVFYCSAMANLQPIVDDWANQRCHPLVMPMAGFLHSPEGVSAAAYTAENFAYCTQTILSNITGQAVQPLAYNTQVLQSLFQSMSQSLQSARGMMDKIRTFAQGISEEVMNRLLNIVVPLQEMVIGVKDLIAKMQGTMTAGLFTFLGSYYALKSLMGAIAQFIITILITLAVMIAAFWVFPFTWGAAVANTSIFVALSIPMAIMLTFMNDVMKVKTGAKIPKLKCFDAQTPLVLANRTIQPISRIQVGDVLQGGSVVTAKIQVAREGSTMYNLDGVIVSDTHIVQLDDDQWVPVSQHPDAIPVLNYDEPFLYCLNTTHKTIYVNGRVFTDWDELYGDTLTQFVHRSGIKHLKDIHARLDCGFASTTCVKMADGTTKELGQVCVGDVLHSGDKVYGVVELDGLDVKNNALYNLGDNCFVEGFAPRLNVARQNMPFMNTHLYHLLTESGTLLIGKCLLPDYNGAIDQWLQYD